MLIRQHVGRWTVLIGSTAVFGLWFDCRRVAGMTHDRQRDIGFGWLWLSVLVRRKGEDDATL